MRKRTGRRRLPILASILAAFALGATAIGSGLLESMLRTRPPLDLEGWTVAMFMALGPVWMILGMSILLVMDGGGRSNEIHYRAPTPGQGFAAWRAFYDASNDGKVLRDLRDRLASPKGPMDWKQADALVMGIRVYALCGHEGLLADACKALADDERSGLVEFVERAKRDYPFVHDTLPRDGDPRIAVMRAHVECVRQADRPIPTSAIKDLKRHNRAFWYAFLNAGRLHRRTFHFEGLPGLVELASGGRDGATTRIADELAEAILGVEPVKEKSA